MADKCVFCSEELKKRALETTDLSFVFLSNPRIAAGHTLIIPKRHVNNFSALSDKEGLDIFRLIGKYQDKILKKLSKGTEIRQNHKPYFPDDSTHVNHFHFHIVPRSKDDEIAKKVDSQRKKLYKKMPEGEENRIIELFK